MFEVGYEGSRSVHEMQVFRFNDARPGEGPRQERRPWPNMTRYYMLLGNGDQTYHGFNFKWEKRPGQYGLTSLLVFSWGKSIDTTGGRLSVTGDPREVSRNLWADGFTYKNRGRGEGNIPMRLAWLKGWDIPFGPAAPTARTASSARSSAVGASTPSRRCRRGTGTPCRLRTCWTWGATHPSGPTFSGIPIPAPGGLRLGSERSPSRRPHPADTGTRGAASSKVQAPSTWTSRYCGISTWVRRPGSSSGSRLQPDEPHQPQLQLEYVQLQPRVFRLHRIGADRKAVAVRPEDLLLVRVPG